MATDSWWTSEGASLFALVRRFSTSNLEICSQSRADLGPSQEHLAFGHSQTAEAASFQRALFTPGADEFLGPPHALAAQMRLHASRRVPPKPYAKLECVGLVFIYIRLLILGTPS